MIKLEKTEVVGWEAAIRGMRNPMNSWDKSDSGWCDASGGGMRCSDCSYSKVFAQMGKYVAMGFSDGIKNSNPILTDDECCNPEAGDSFCIGKHDYELMMKLVKGGPVHAKFRRMIVVYVDITAPLYWWKEFDTYKVGTVANSCSTMHKIAAKEFTIDDFSTEHLYSDEMGFLCGLISVLNGARELYLDGKRKSDWWQMIQLLPTSYNQKRTVMLNYEVLVNIYQSRKNHKLGEWRTFCRWIESLHYSELITTGVERVKETPTYNTYVTKEDLNDI